jgi:uncharacterized protein (TIGR01777 family)
VADLTELPGEECFDVLLNLAGAPVAGGLWTAKRQAYLLASRVGTTAAINAWLARVKQAPRVWIQASAIGFYGVRPAAEQLDEASLAGGGFMAKLCVDWEAEAVRAVPTGTRQVVLRLGVVLDHGGALTQLLRPIRCFVGGRIGNGQQIMSWIHRSDLLALFARAAGHESMRGVYNAVAPGAVSQLEFAQAAGRALGRPIWLPLPAAPLRWLLGEMAELFVDGQYVVPDRLASEGFKFAFPDIDSALATVIGN